MAMLVMFIDDLLLYNPHFWLIITSPAKAVASPHPPVGNQCCLQSGDFLKWIGLRENLQETIDFPLNLGFSCKHFP